MNVSGNILGVLNFFIGEHLAKFLPENVKFFAEFVQQRPTALLKSKFQMRFLFSLMEVSGELFHTFRAHCCGENRAKNIRISSLWRWHVTRVYPPLKTTFPSISCLVPQVSQRIAMHSHNRPFQIYR